jgi:hypothetical protein
MSLSAE